MDSEALARLRFRPSLFDAVHFRTWSPEEMKERWARPEPPRPWPEFGFPVVECDIDKAWSAIDFILTGTKGESALPLGFLLTGGQDVPVDNDYGPPRVISPEQVKAIARALDPITGSVFSERFNYEELSDANLYGIGDKESEDREYVLAHFESLRSFLLDAEKHGEGVVIHAG